MGRFCYICQEHKANEKFTGKGHRKGICKTCYKLSNEDRQFLRMKNHLDELSNTTYPGKKKVRELKKHAESNKDLKARRYAKERYMLLVQIQAFDYALKSLEVLDDFENEVVYFYDSHSIADTLYNLSQPYTQIDYPDLSDEITWFDNHLNQMDDQNDSKDVYIPYWAENNSIL